MISRKPPSESSPKHGIIRQFPFPDFRPIFPAMPTPASDVPARPGDDRPVAHFSFRDEKCGDCGGAVREGDLFLYETERIVCLSCAGLDRLIFLPSGKVALTRRATKHSTLSAVVVKYSRRRKRNERQGVLVEPAALERAEAECLSDEEARARTRERAALRREVLDGAYIKKFEARLLEMYPACPPGEARAITEHACEKHSGRVGRSAAAKELADEAITLAVRASIRHGHTPYDGYLADGVAREEARRLVRDRIDEVEAEWSGGSA